MRKGQQTKVARFSIWNNKREVSRKDLINKIKYLKQQRMANLSLIKYLLRDPLSLNILIQLS